MLKEIELDIDYQRLVNEVLSMGVIDFLHANARQMSVQHRGITGDKQLTESCQSLVYDWDRYDQTIDNEPPVRDQILDERSFIETCDMFKGTYIGNVVEFLKLRYGVYRGRFMLMRYKTCLSMHVDQSPRLHIPIITNQDSFMVVDDVVCRLQYGKSYIVDTRLPHTAVNSGKKDRTHLVFCVNDF